MISLLFAVLAAGQLAMAVTAFRWRRAAPGLLSAVPAAVCTALVWDNGVIALGSTLGTGPLLETLSVPRFVLHALLTPWLVLWSLAATRQAGLRRARQRWAYGVAVGLTAVLIVAGVLHDVLGLSFEAEQWAGTVRYVNAAASPVGPLPAIVSGLVVLAAGVALWWRVAFPWLALAALVMAVVSGAAAQVPLLGNAGEVLLNAGVLLTAHRFAPGNPHRPAPAPIPPSRTGTPRTD